jgi:hypothetical protein
LLILSASFAQLYHVKPEDHKLCLSWGYSNTHAL